MIAWTVVSAYLGVGVGVADLCSEPHGESLLVSSLYLSDDSKLIASTSFSVYVKHKKKLSTLVFVRDYGGYLHKDDFNRFHHLLNCSHDTPNSDRYVKELRTAAAAYHDAQLTMDDLDIRVRTLVSN